MADSSNAAQQDAAAKARIISHMNADHQDSVRLLNPVFVKKFTGDTRTDHNTR